VHGALSEAVRRLQAWERRQGRRLSFVLQAGDLGVFASPERLDKQTRRRAAEDPTELDLLDYLQGRQKLPWDLWFVHGNHEDFDLLAERGQQPLDPAGRLHWLADGRVHLLGGLRVAALGGIQPPKVSRPELPRYIQPAEVQSLLALPPGSADLLLCHDGPIGRCLVGMPWAGSVAVYDLVKHLRPRFCLFGHYDRPPPPTRLNGCTLLCLNLPGPWRLPRRDGGVAVLDSESWRVSWVDDQGAEHPQPV
jgi:hypothetical protein